MSCNNAGRRAEGGAAIFATTITVATTLAGPGPSQTATAAALVVDLMQLEGGASVAPGVERMTVSALVTDPSSHGMTVFAGLDVGDYYDFDVPPHIYRTFDAGSCLLQPAAASDRGRDHVQTQTTGKPRHCRWCARKLI